MLYFPRAMSRPEDQPFVVRFAAFEVDLRAGELRKHGLKIKLQDQPLQLLALLLERPGQVVTREELQKRLWPADTFVDFDRGLNKAINRLREALSDSADHPRFIETLPKRGYRFIEAVDSAQPAETRVAPIVPETSPPPVRPQRPKYWRLAALVAILIAGAVVAFFYSRRTRSLTGQDVIVLADFENRTGDSAFDYTLKQALAIDLGQSPYLKILSDQEVADTLRLMGRSPDQPLKSDIARNVCQRTGSKVVLSGSIANLGSEFVVGVNVTNCLTGEIVAQEQARANHKEEVLKALDGAASGLRRKLGESLSSIQKFDRPIQQDVSTSSFEAFQAFTTGQKIVLEKGRSAAIPFFKRATELDPQFALGYMALGLLYGAIGETILSAENSRKAYELRDHVSESEKFLILEQYYLNVTGELEKIPQVCEIWAQTYPRDRISHERLGRAYVLLGRPENALFEYQAAQRLGDLAITRVGLAHSYILLDRWREAGTFLRQSLALNADQPFYRQELYLLSFLEKDTATMQAQVAWATHMPGSEGDFTFLQSDSEAYSGRLGKARDLTRLAVESAQHSDFHERASLWQAVEAAREALAGNSDLAIRTAQAALELAAGLDVRALAALAFARAGDAAQAGGLAEKLAADFPLNTILQNYWLPTVRAEIELAAGNAARAIELLQTAGSYELADTPLPLIPVYVRAEAFLAAKRADSAAAEFQKILQHRGIARNSIVGALAQLGLARAYALSGDTAKARSAYQDFSALWKTADPGIPVLKAAKAEFAAITAAVH